MNLLPAEGPFRQVVQAHDLLFISGIVCADVAHGEDALGDISKETRLVLQALEQLLVQHDSGLERVVRVDVHIADIALKPAMDAVYAEFFRPGTEPTRTTVAVSGLFGGSLVEITAIAVLTASKE